MDAGKVFDLPVDSEHKALKIKLLSVAAPHMRQFHLCWVGFFAAFVSTFAPAALMTVIREALSLDVNSIGNSGAFVISCLAIAAYIVPSARRFRE
jgi:MFS transporter, NNP family, nitrate/nitrite transporter